MFRALTTMLPAIVCAGLATPLSAGTVDAPFDRGDVNQDGMLNIADPISLLDFLFSGGVAPACDDAADANDDGQLNIGDGVYLLAHLFNMAAAPPPPFGAPGPDPTADPLGCASVDCLNEAELTVLLGLVPGTLPLPGAIPINSTTVAGLATVTVGPGDAELNLAMIDIDIGTASVTANGTITGTDIPVEIDLIIGGTITCTADISLDWNLDATFVTAPFGTGAVELISVGTTTFNTANTSIDPVGCGIAGSLASALASLLSGTVDDLVNDAVQPAVADIIAEVDALLATTTVIVCDP